MELAEAEEAAIQELALSAMKRDIWQENVPTKILAAATIEEVVEDQEVETLTETMETQELTSE